MLTALALLLPVLAGASDLRGIKAAPEAGSSAGAPAPIVLEVPALGPERLAAADLRLGPAGLAPATAALPVLAAPAAPDAAPASAAPQAARQAAQAPAPAPSGAPAEEELAAGRALFDHAGEAPRGALSRAVSAVGRWFSERVPGRESIPPWPGRAGDHVRVGGKTWILDRRAGEGSTAVVWVSRGEPAAAVKLAHPEEKSELFDLEALGHTDIPHARLLAASRDGRAIAKEFIAGPTAAGVMKEGRLDFRQKAALADLAARFLSIGYRADLTPGNLVWEKWRGRWVLVDAGGFRMGGPADVLHGILYGEYAFAGGLDRLAFLRALRARLGPDSPAWRAAANDLWGHPLLVPLAEALLEHDRGARPAPKVVFAARAPARPFDDSLVLRPELHRRLGGNILGLPRVQLSTQEGKRGMAYEIETPGGERLVLKLAPWEAVRRELFMRKVIARWFSRYFRAPPVLAAAGSPALLVMPFERGGPRRRGDRLAPDARAALALLAQTFGLVDLSEDHLLVGGPAGPVLIDFEHSLARRRPNPARLPDENILAEMPWVSRVSENQAEDFAPAVRAWRGLLARPETQAELSAMLRDSGFSAREADEALETIRANAADLEWSLQADVEFANFLQHLLRRGDSR